MLGEVREPVAEISHASTSGAKPPNTVTPTLYAMDMPVVRMAVGNISLSSAGMGPKYRAMTRPSTTCTAVRVATVGTATSHRNSG